jgi:hypothetical protein
MSYFPGICFKGLRNTIRNVWRRKCPSPDSNSAPPKYKFRELPLQNNFLSTALLYWTYSVSCLLCFIWVCWNPVSRTHSFLEFCTLSQTIYKVQITIATQILAVPTVHILCLPDRQHNKHEEIAHQHSEEVCSGNAVCLTQHHAHRLVSVVAIVQSCIHEETLQHRSSSILYLRIILRELWMVLTWQHCQLLQATCTSDKLHNWTIYFNAVWPPCSGMWHQLV